MKFFKIYNDENNWKIIYKNNEKEYISLFYYFISKNKKLLYVL